MACAQNSHRQQFLGRLKLSRITAGSFPHGKKSHPIGGVDLDAVKAGVNGVARALTELVHHFGDLFFRDGAGDGVLFLALGGVHLARGCDC